MNKHQYDRIFLGDLRLDLENPRHDALQDQTAVLRDLLERQAKKILKLAKDIVAEGTNPADLPIVIPDPTAPGKYIVVEGNRRVAVLQLLNNPGLAETAGKLSLKRQFENLVKEPGTNRPDKLDCVVFNNREDANHWIELRHTGEREGIGIVPWDVAAIERFKKGQSWRALKVVNFVKQKAHLDALLKKQIERMPLTNLARLVNDPDVRNALGLTVEKDNFQGHFPEADLVKALTKVVNDIATKEINVNDIRSKAQRQEYIGKLVDSRYVPRDPNLAVPPWDLTTAVAIPKAPRIRPIPASRKTIIPTNCPLRIRKTRINKIYGELKRLDTDKFANCAAVMLRIFLEFSLEYYINEKKISLRTGANLSTKLQAVIKFLETNKILCDSELKPIRVAISNKDALFSIDTLHAYVHNPNFAPKANDLKTTWDYMQAFMEAIWR